MPSSSPTTGKGPDKIDNPKDVIQFLDGGKVAKSKFFGGYFWSGDMLVGINDDQALKWRSAPSAGVISSSSSAADSTPSPKDSEDVRQTLSASETHVPKDWHCGYHVYVRQWNP
jgi:hypothetical protein